MKRVEARNRAPRTKTEDVAPDLEFDPMKVSGLDQRRKEICLRNESNKGLLRSKTTTAQINGGCVFDGEGDDLKK
uniref:Uncharacterized protein n=1 Tax=Lotus japonicus TaxID=34305 RepID=I3S241_LOTJA|nr:unknown [Lotus japonicus]